MKLLEELLLSYAGKDPQTQRFLLTQALDHIPDQNSADVMAFLWKEVGSGEATVRRQARYVLGQYLPRHHEHAYALAPTQSGLWTDFMRIEHGQMPAAAFPPPAPLVPPEVVAQRVATAADCQAPALARVADLLKAGSPECRGLASFVLGRFWTPALFDQLARQVTADELNFACAFALAELGGDAAQQVLVRAARAHGPGRPDIYVLLRSFRSDTALACLADAQDRTNAVGRANIALALAGQDARASRPILEKLILRKEGWVTAYALDTLAGHATPESFPLIQRAFESESHEFIRMQAVRAAGTILSDASADFCLKRLEEGSPRIEAVALEALARQGLRPAELNRHARARLTSELVRTRVHSLLIALTSDPDEHTDALDEMVLSPDPLCRLEAAYLLGYFQGPGSADLLARMAAVDPDPGVQREAVKSLARYDPEDAMELLLKLLDGASPTLAEATCRSLTRLPETLNRVVISELSAQWKRTPRGAAGGSLLRGMGALAAAATLPPPPALLEGLAHADEAVLLGALEGAARLGNLAPTAELQALLAHPMPHVRARAAGALVLAGLLDAGRVLAELLAMTDEPTKLAALHALLELGAVLPAAVGSPRFTKLASALGLAAPAARQEPPAWTPPSAAPVRSQHTGDVVAPKKVALRSVSAKGPESLCARYRPPPPPRPSRAIQTAPSKAAVHPWLIGAGLVTLFLIGLLFSRLRGDSVASTSVPASRRPVRNEPGTLRAFFVNGECQRGAAPAAPVPLKIGDVVRSGEEVLTGTGSKVSLMDAGGSTVWLGPSSRVRLEAGRTAAAVALTFLAGDCVADFRAHAEASVQVGAAAVQLRQGSVRVSDAPGGPEVELTGGAGTLQRANASMALVVGQRTPVAPGR